MSTLYALLLAIGSSTDNFAVGASLGFSEKKLQVHANLIVSVANAFGAFLSCSGGRVLEHLLYKGIAPTLGGLAFAYLAYDEYINRSVDGTNISINTNNDKDTAESKNPQLHDCTDKNTSSSSATMTLLEILQMAIPMTLNNIAGGVAGAKVWRLHRALRRGRDRGTD